MYREIDWGLLVLFAGLFVVIAGVEASTMAGNLTLLGSVANLIVVEQARGAGIHIGFVEHGKVGLPVTPLTLLVGWLLLIV